MIIFAGSNGGSVAGQGRKRLSALAAFSVLAAPLVAIGATGSTVTEILNTPDQQAASAAALATKVRTEILNLPGSASVEDLEAAIMFVLSQEEADVATIGDALDILSADKDATDARKQAIANIRLALLKKKLKTGTGAIRPGTGSGTGSTGGFGSSPSVGLGFGTANYSS